MPSATTAAASSAIRKTATAHSVLEFVGDQPGAGRNAFYPPPETLLWQFRYRSMTAGFGDACANVARRLLIGVQTRVEPQPRQRKPPHCRADLLRLETARGIRSARCGGRSPRVTGSHAEEIMTATAFAAPVKADRLFLESGEAPWWIGSCAAAR